MSDLPSIGPRAGRSRTDIAAWRRARLVLAGFDDEAAIKLAHECAIDLHALLELIDSGCPPAFAARIVAPLDGETRPC